MVEGTARALGASEADALTLHELPVLRGEGRRKLHRWSYGLVWDREAGNLADAMYSVAGYTDKAEWERSGRSTAEHLVATLQIGAHDDVLEVGCGAARVGVHLAPRCRRWIGADVSANMIRFAASALQNQDNISLKKLNGLDLSGIPAESVDVAYSTAVFMHLDEWDRFRYVQEFTRVLRPGGRVYFDKLRPSKSRRMAAVSGDVIARHRRASAERQ